MIYNYINYDNPELRHVGQHQPSSKSLSGIKSENETCMCQEGGRTAEVDRNIKVRTDIPDCPTIPGH